MRLPTKLTLAAVAASGLAFAASGASAAVVCNANNECWHVRGHHYDYRPEWNVVVHPDNWRWNRTEHYRWREHSGRGYWRDGIWIKF
jgi:hypothetical protein